MSMAGNIAEYLRYAEFCGRMAARAHSPEMKADWLVLAGKWIALTEDNRTAAGSQWLKATLQRPRRVA